jgi:hypothetical protein
MACRLHDRTVDIRIAAFEAARWFSSSADVEEALKRDVLLESKREQPGLVARPDGIDCPSISKDRAAADAGLQGHCGYGHLHERSASVASTRPSGTGRVRRTLSSSFLSGRALQRPRARVIGYPERDDSLAKRSDGCR